ncbi:MAG: hypothetical protein WD058_07635 [Dehalococcoidia bacterium]
MATNPTALLIIRAQFERDTEVPLRVYVRSTNDVSAGFEKSFILSDADKVLEVIRDWLTRLQDLAEAGV